MLRTLLACTTLIWAAPLPAQQGNADLIVVNARIYTVDATRPLAHAMAIGDGRVLFVGSRRGAEALAGPETTRLDLQGRELTVTATATADQLAAAAGLLMVKDAGVPAVWVEGISPTGDGRVAQTLREPELDLFR